MNEKEFFDEMIRSVEEDDAVTLRKMKSSLDKKKYIFSTKIISKAFIPDPHDEWVQLNRSITIKINDEDVYDYSDINYGYYGSAGSGWFVEEEENSLDQNVMESLSYFGIKWPDLVVPKPEELKANFDRIMSEIIEKDGYEEESINDFDYWLIDDAFVAEPFIGGQQIGELSEINIADSMVLRISQEDFDKLMNEYREVYGQFPDQ